MRKKQYSRMTALLLAVGLSAASLTGCGIGDGNGTKVVLTTGFNKDEIFRIETSTCTLPELDRKSVV